MNTFQALSAWLLVYGFPDPQAPNGLGIDTTFQQLITSLLQLGLMFGTLFQGPLSKFVGRRWSFWIGLVINAIGVSIQIGVGTHGAVYAGRFLVGIANGFYTSATILYIQEVSPANLRGSMTALYVVLQGLGGVIASAVTYSVQNNLEKYSYQMPLGILYVIPGILAFTAILIPESPRWLANMNRYEEATRALQRLRGSDCPQENVLIEIEEIRATITVEKEMQRGYSYIEIFRGTNVRRTLLSIGASIVQPSSGIMLMVGYLTYFLQLSGISEAFQYTMVANVVGLIGAVGGMFAIRYFGRRPLFMFGTISACVCMLIIASTYTGLHGSTVAGRIEVAFVNLYLFVYSFAIGSVSWTVAGEIPSNHLRSQTLTIAMASNSAVSVVVSATVPLIFESKLVQGPRVAFIFFASNLVISAWIFFFLPEVGLICLDFD